MNKKTKKSIATLLTIFTLSVPVYAGETIQDIFVVNDVMFCGCGHTIKEHQDFVSNKNPSTSDQSCICGEPLHTSVVYEDDWVYTGESKNCAHNHIYGHDYKQEKLVKSKVTCCSCGYMYYFDIIKTRWVCKGFNG